jgi:energy-coupling factor transporter transmembrane protein EcfT
MAELSGFTFRPGNSFLHCMDVRCKFILLSLFGFLTLNIEIKGLALLLLVSWEGMIRIGLSPATLLRELRFFSLFLLVILIIRSFSTPGEPWIQIQCASISREGVFEGLEVCARMTVVVCFGLLFSATTRPSDVRTAVIWLLKPFSKKHGQRAATMISLLVRFLPMILTLTREIQNAQSARCVESLKNPIRRTALLIIPLIRRSFQTADQLAAAMDARCYNEDRTEPPPSIKRTDWVILSVSGIVFLCFL